MCCEEGGNNASFEKSGLALADRPHEAQAVRRTVSLGESFSRLIPCRCLGWGESGTNWP